MKLDAFLMRASTICALTFIASVTSSPLVVHERRYASTNVRRGARVDETSVVAFRVGLKQTNLEKAYEYLLNISHPASPHYGKVWSAEDVRKTFAPSKETVETVQEWLTSVGIDDITESHGWLTFQSTVGYVENILKAEFFEHKDDESEIVRMGCDRYHLPSHISKHVDYITPGVALSAPLQKRSLSKRQPPSRQLPQPRWLSPNLNYKSRRHPEPATPWWNRDPAADPLSPRSTQLPAELQDCGRRMTPVCIRALYGLPSPKEVASSYNSGSANSLGVFEDTGSNNQSNLNLFFSLYAPEIPKGTSPVTYFINAPPTHYQDYETNLDLMIMYPIVYPQTITVYQTEFYLNGKWRPDSYVGLHFVLQELLDAVDASFCKDDPIPNSAGKECGTLPLTRVISISYGSSEVIQPQPYLHRQCNEFMKLALRGTTVTVASGDNGVATDMGYNGVDLANGCIVPGNFSATRPGSSIVGNGTVFSNSWPATCPYVLSVGGTELGRNETIGDPESVMDLTHEEGIYSKDDYRYASGGRPSYQDKAINSYFAQHDPGYPYYIFNGVDFSQPGNNIGANGGVYNRAGRGVPDVSAVGRHVSGIASGKQFTYSGTSCATPIWASVFTLINEKRSQSGKAPVGFVNPVLYEHPEVFNDVTLGRNPGCFTKGFSAVEGWDPVTGLGTPNFPKLLELFMSLP